jgi:DNA helicase-2/ATP-dependent DNA helicase PcrA
MNGDSVVTGNELLADLNEPQREAVRHVDGPLLVLAGAGSGKTRVITRRVAYLIAQGVTPWQVLAITFTNKAAGEMRDRVSALNTPPGATVCTFHSLCARLLRQFATEARLEQHYTIYDRNDQLRITREAIESLHLSGSYLTPAKAHAAISNAKNELKTAAGYAEGADNFFARNVAEVYRKYEQILSANNALDFDDLLMRVAFLLRDRPDVRQTLIDRYRYVQIDEYQDTNHAQYLIAHTLAMGTENICATGDPDQSIYAWRGADINNILEFEADYPNTKVIRLEENYRSVQPILSAASKLIACNTMRKDKTLFTRRAGGDDVRTLLVDDEHAEARQLAERIEACRIDGAAYGDVAVFYRVNSLSRVLEEALIRKGVPYRIARGVEFYNRKEVKDLLAYLKLIVNPADDLSCRRIVNTPTRGIGATTIKRLDAYASMHSLGLLAAAQQADQAGLAQAATKKIGKFAAMIASISGKLDQPMRYVLSEIYSSSGLEELHSRGDEESRQARANIDELITAAAEFDEENPDSTAADYLQQVSLISDLDHLSGGEGAVTLMTLHAAKGLEFPVVFIVGCEEGLLPFARESANKDAGEKGENPAALEEERRLAFVGMTRAMDRLTLSAARTRMIRGQRTPMAASRFLHEIGEESVCREDLTTALPLRSRDGRAGPRRGGFFREVEQREVIEAIPDSHFSSDIHAHPDADSEYEEVPFPPEYEYLRPGCMVRHPKFGVGKLVKLSRPWPDTRATVLFHDFGQKTLVLAVANVQMMDDVF